MLLAIDVGNTNTVIGAYRQGQDELIDHWRASTVASRTADEWLMLFRDFLSWSVETSGVIDAVVLASVVPKVTDNLRRMCGRLGVEPLVVDWSTDTGMPVLLDNPREVGADRLANAVAAYAAEGGPAIVVDMGTATTLDVVSVNGEYLGGVILPGMEISLDALFDRAAALKRVDLIPPDNVIGKSTVGAVRSGATYGYAAQVDGLCERIEKELGPCRIISTGGLAGVIAPLSDRIQRHDPWLTLHGLRLIQQRLAGQERASTNGTNNV